MSGGWKQQAKETRKSQSPLAGWCDANLSLPFARRLALLVSKNEALPHVVGILKEFRGKGEVLNSAQRIAVEAQLKGAGPWSGSEATLRAAAPRRQRAPAAGPAAGQRRGAGNTSEMAALRAELATLKAAALAGPAEGQPSRRARRASRRVNGASTGPATVPVEAEGDVPAPAGWQCTLCERLHPQPAK